MSDLTDSDTQYIEKQLEALEEQRDQIEQDEDLSDSEKARELKKIELVHAQLVERSQEQHERSNEQVYEKSNDFFGD